MSVNGVAINVGQKWINQKGVVVTIELFEADDPDCPWIGSTGWCYDKQGHCPADPEQSLVSLHGVTDPGTKSTNPKEAIGDKKVPLWLCSTIAMAHWAAAQVAGLLKYGAWNWRAAGVRASTYISAINRHLGRYANGERLDPVDGTHHLGNIMACCAILLEAEAIGKLNDDRAPSVSLQKTFDEVEGIMDRLREQYKDRAPKHWTIEDVL